MVHPSAEQPRRDTGGRAGDGYTSAQHRTVNDAVAAGAHCVPAPPRDDPIATLKPPAQGELDHERLRSPAHPLPRASSPRSSGSVHRRAPEAAQKEAAVAKLTGPQQPKRRLEALHTAGLPYAAAFVQPKLAQLRPESELT